MSRAERLLQLTQVLRIRRRPVSGSALAEELDVSLRTIYRDIATLQAQGAHIEGEPGVGYILRPGFMLPPMMFSSDELEALVLGSRWVASRTDPKLAEAAKNALAKIERVLPDDLQFEVENSTLIIIPGEVLEGSNQFVGQLREAVRTEQKAVIAYRDLYGQETTRTIWPFALGFMDQARVLAAWCELRKGYRHFRTDRIQSIEVLDERYPRRRRALLREWKEVKSINNPEI